MPKINKEILEKALLAALEKKGDSNYGHETKNFRAIIKNGKINFKDVKLSGKYKKVKRKEIVKEKRLKQEKGKTILERSGVFGDEKAWKKAREVYLRPIDRNGSVLDVGCANGYLLYSLMKGSKHKLIPYGIDVVPELIEEAKKILPNYKKHFFVADLNSFKTKKRFTFVIIGHNVCKKKICDKYYKMVEKGGRLIISAYDDSKDFFEQLEDYVSSFGLKVSGKFILDGITALVWVNK